jgi:hypothetical protein
MYFITASQNLDECKYSTPSDTTCGTTEISSLAVESVDVDNASLDVPAEVFDTLAKDGAAASDVAF